MSEKISKIAQQLKRHSHLNVAQIEVARTRIEEGADLLKVLKEMGVSEAQINQMNLRQYSKVGFSSAPKKNAFSKGLAPQKRELPRLTHGQEQKEEIASPVDELTNVLLDVSDRFEIFEEIAHGAMGKIEAGWDRHLGRPVAIKTLRSDRAKDVVRMRFLEEAQVTGQLQHPSIITIYELGRIHGNVAFVMRRVEGQSLKQLIHRLRRDDEEMIERFPLSQKVQIFHKLCQAVAFAHSRGVIHRDIKPSNVMIGDFGDVVLLDWGLCKIIGQEVRSSRSSTERWQTVHGQIIGTPAYMSPEQALGMIDQISPATDVYGLGALLYHLLTLHPPFTGKSNREVVRRVLHAELVSLRDKAPDAEIPSEIERICLKCLHRDSDQRYLDAGELAKDVGSFIDRWVDQLDVDQTSSTFNPTYLAESLSSYRADIEENLFHYQAIQEDLASAQDNWHTTRLQAWLNSDELILRERWDAQLQILHYRRESESLLAKMCEQLSHYQQILSLRQQHAEGTKPDGHKHSDETTDMLCTLLASRYENAVIEGDEVAQAQLGYWLKSFDPIQGDMISQAVGALYIHVRPINADIQLWQCIYEAGVLKKTRPKTLKSSPLLLERVPAGQYVLSASLADGVSRVESGMRIYPGVTTRLSVTLYHKETAPDGFVHIPAGTFRSGPPNDLYSPATELALPDIFISQAPVTADEYLTFLKHLIKTAPKEARLRQPRRSGDGRPLWRWDANHHLHIPLDEGWTLNTPVIGVSMEDAAQYCQWLSLKEKKNLRLPTESEWEKSARGMDGRSYPWGDVWDPRYVAGPELWDHHLPPPVGLMSSDASLYGVQDLVGGVREWTTSTELHFPYGIVRGGSFLTDDLEGRPLWRRAILPPNRTAQDLGFRVAHVPDPAFRILEMV